MMEEMQELWSANRILQKKIVEQQEKAKGQEEEADCLQQLKRRRDSDAAMQVLGRSLERQDSQVSSSALAPPPRPIGAAPRRDKDLLSSRPAGVTVSQLSARASSITVRSVEPAAPPPSGSIRAPTADAHRLNEASILAVQSSQPLRQ